MVRSLVVSSLALAFFGPAVLHAQTDYPLTEDSKRRSDVPQGTVTAHTWTSQIYPGTRRDYWVYVPAQYRPETPAAVMVFQDGGGYVSEQGRWQVPIVFDNLIHKGEMPVTVGIFIDPGVLPPVGLAAGALPDSLPDRQARYNRSFEYDALGDRYARFLLEEILPAVGKTLNLTTDPNLRAIGGSSSGASCAFTVAWNRPDAFRRVLSFIGSYVPLRGADIYPNLIRKTEPKPLRVFLQDGRNDLNIYSGSWWAANQTMSSALEYAGYDATFVTGDQAHNNIHGSAILPDALRWLWRNWSEPIVKSTGKAGAERHFVTEILDPAQGWEQVSQGHGLAEDLAVDRQGNVYFADVPKNRIHRIEHATGRVTAFKENTGGARGLGFAPDGRLYACQGSRNRIVAYSPEGAEAVVARDTACRDLVVSARGEVWFTDPAHRGVGFVDSAGAIRTAFEGLDGLVSAGTLGLSPDQSLLTLADPGSRWVWSFQVGANGTLVDGQAFYRLEAADEKAGSGAAGMTVDSEGFLYVATRTGVQVCDQPGRVNAILAPPGPGAVSSVVFGGPSLDTLYATAGDAVYRRKVRRTGVHPWQPVKPPKPRL